MGVYAEIESNYEPIKGSWQTHDLDGWINWHNRINKNGELLSEKGELITDVTQIDIISPFIIDREYTEYRLTLERGSIILVEDLNDKDYWEAKYKREEKEYWDSLSLLGKIKEKIQRTKSHIRWLFIFKYRRKWLAQQLVAPIATPRDYSAIGRKCIIVEEENKND